MLVKITVPTTVNLGYMFARAGFCNFPLNSELVTLCHQMKAELWRVATELEQDQALD